MNSSTPLNQRSVEENVDPPLRSFTKLLGAVVVVQFAFGTAIYFSFDNDQARGTFGDMFGAVNTLFSGFAFAGVIYAILLQQVELRLQRQELSYTREELRRSAIAQEQSSQEQAKQSAEFTKQNKEFVKQVIQQADQNEAFVTATRLSAILRLWEMEESKRAGFLFFGRPSSFRGRDRQRWYRDVTISLLKSLEEKTGIERTLDGDTRSVTELQDLLDDMELRRL